MKRLTKTKISNFRHVMTIPLTLLGIYLAVKGIVVAFNGLDQVVKDFSIGQSHNMYPLFIAGVYMASAYILMQIVETDKEWVI